VAVVAVEDLPALFIAPDSITRRSPGYVISPARLSVARVQNG